MSCRLKGTTIGSISMACICTKRRYLLNSSCSLQSLPCLSHATFDTMSGVALTVLDRVLIILLAVLLLCPLLTVVYIALCKRPKVNQEEAERDFVIIRSTAEMDQIIQTEQRLKASHSQHTLVLPHSNSSSAVTLQSPPPAYYHQSHNNNEKVMLV